MESKVRNTKEDYRRARLLRNDASPFERLLWDGIRKMMVARKIKFRRQQPIHPYIADFSCMKARLLVELDGLSHDTRLSYDEKRDADLRSRGFYILRFRNEDVVENLEAVVGMIFNEAERLIRDKELV
ncbi:MAG: endonuclease domain-containing protein [Alphaproteobacteria bacterium]|nr:endonuclease domain-containing protein [Alphaproteobacteria bacterium]